MTRSRSWALAEDAMGEDAEIAADVAQDVAHHQPVEDAVGVVGDRGPAGPSAGCRTSAAADDVEREAVAFGDDLPEVAALRDFGLVALGAADQPQAAGGVFQHADHGAAAAWAARSGVADVARDLIDSPMAMSAFPDCLVPRLMARNPYLTRNDDARRKCDGAAFRRAPLGRCRPRGRRRASSSRRPRRPFRRSASLTGPKPRIVSGSSASATARWVAVAG